MGMHYAGVKVMHESWSKTITLWKTMHSKCESSHQVFVLYIVALLFAVILRVILFQKEKQMNPSLGKGYTATVNVLNLADSPGPLIVAMSPFSDLCIYCVLCCAPCTSLSLLVRAIHCFPFSVLYSGKHLISWLRYPRASLWILIPSFVPRYLNHHLRLVCHTDLSGYNYRSIHSPKATQCCKMLIYHRPSEKNKDRGDRTKKSERASKDNPTSRAERGRQAGSKLSSFETSCRKVDKASGAAPNKS